MVISKDIKSNDLIKEVAKELKKLPEMRAPEWADFVKTGTHKDRPPIDPDWWYTRSAAVLFKIQNFGPIGVSKLRTFYGGKKNRGVKPAKFMKGSGNILRKILQQLDVVELTKKVEKDQRRGRVITPKGVSLLDTISSKIKKTSKKE
ncbi:30S ribosomal protein S19e [Candidatus Woesearchaeota archaeon]|nr:30S ribosomal protein S19e [Candidatus Woesearchaeota archaeon]